MRRGGFGFGFVVVVAVVVLTQPAADATIGPMRLVTFHRPAGSGCATVTGVKAAASGTGIGWDGSRVLVSCWADRAIDRYTPAGGLVDVVAVSGLPGPGLGGVSWDADHRVWWACAVDGSISNKAKSNLVGYITANGSWHQAAIAPHGCINNVTYHAGRVYADGAYAKSQATSTTVDVGAVTVGDDGQPRLPARLIDLHPALWSPHTSGNLFDDSGQLDWQADPFGTTKTIWHQGVKVLSTTLRIEQLACDEATGTVYVKWFNQNRFGVIAGLGC